MQQSLGLEARRREGLTNNKKRRRLSASSDTDPKGFGYQESSRFSREQHWRDDQRRRRSNSRSRRSCSSSSSSRRSVASSVRTEDSSLHSRHDSSQNPRRSTFPEGRSCVDTNNVMIHPKLKGRFIPAPVVVKTKKTTGPVKKRWSLSVESSAACTSTPLTEVSTTASEATEESSTFSPPYALVVIEEQQHKGMEQFETEAKKMEDTTYSRSSTTTQENTKGPSAEKITSSPQTKESEKEKEGSISSFVAKSIPEEVSQKNTPSSEEKSLHTNPTNSEKDSSEKNRLKSEQSPGDSPTASTKEESPSTDERSNIKKKHDNDKSPNQVNPHVERVKIGSRIAVYWDGEGEYFKGTITKHRQHSKKPFFVRYDDGDREWINLNKETFRLLKRKQKTAAKTAKKASPDSIKKKESKATVDTKKDAKADARETPDGRANVRAIIKKTTEAPAASDDKKAMDDKPMSVKAVLKNTGDAKAASNTIKRKADAYVVDAEEFWSDSFTFPKIMGHCEDENWVAAGARPRESSDSETDEEEIMQWGQEMFGISPRPIARPKPKEPEFDWSAWTNEPVHIPISEAVKLGRRRGRSDSTAVVDTVPRKKKRKKSHERAEAAADVERQRTEAEQEARRKKEAARPLTAAEIRKILGEEGPCCESAHWVRRSVRQPSRSALNSPLVKALIDKLKSNDTDMIVLKMKKYVNDPAAPQIIIDAVLDALEENTNCEALYIQNFNEGMCDEQVLRLLEILKRPSCKIWCLNIGETYKVKHKTWKAFADGLKDTKITHMYASEHTITSQLKEQIRRTIRDNRKKHNMHIDPENLDTILQCTHCWWNPMNAKVLRPYIRKRGCEYMLHDKEVQGLPGSKSASTIT